MNQIRYKLYPLLGRILNKMRINPYLFRFLFKKNNVTITETEILEQLKLFHPDNGGSSIRSSEQNRNIQYDIQVIVPVYNVESYLEYCLDTILSQEFTGSYIITIVNDGSTDSSPKILKKYEDNQNCEIIHKENGGLSSARNKALDYIKGRYLLFVDSDDAIPENTLQTLFDEAENKKVDVVYGPYKRINSSNEVIENYYPRQDKLKGCICGKLYKSSIFNNLIFPDKYWFEDTIVSMIIGSSINKFSYIENMVYLYRINDKGISQRAIGNHKMLDTLYITKRILGDQEKLNKKFKLYDYDIFLEQVKMNKARISTISDLRINYLAFQLHCILINKFPNFKSKDKKLKLLEWSLKNHSYEGYLISN